MGGVSVEGRRLSAAAASSRLWQGVLGMLEGLSALSTVEPLPVSCYEEMDVGGGVRDEDKATDPHNMKAHEL